MFDHLPSVSRRVLLTTAPVGLYRVVGAAVDRGPRYSPVEDAVVPGTWVLLGRVMRAKPLTSPNHDLETLEKRKDGLWVVLDYARAEDAEFWAYNQPTGAKVQGESRGAKVETV